MTLPVDWLNDAADAIKAPSNFTHIGLRNSGVELAGGAPAYARKAPVFSATANGDTQAVVVFDVPAGSTVNEVVFHTALSGGAPTHVRTLTTPETFGAQGTYTLTVTIDAD
jgi:hypothetical protein